MSLPYKNPSLSIEARIEDLLARMSLEEKAGQMTQWFNLGEEHYDMVRRGEIGSDLLANSSTAGNDLQERVFATTINTIQHIAVEESRLGIPLIFGRDVIHGYRTIAPIPLGIAAAWSPELTEAAYAIAAKEARADGIQWAFAPMLDIARDPRWGRIAEGFGEDPYLAGELAKAAVKGYQGVQVDEKTNLPTSLPPDCVAACAKHYAGYGAAEGGRDYNSAEITRHTLQNVYLPPFRAAVEAGVASLMSGFHTIGGIPASAHHYLLTEVLREQWGFKGTVVSDWSAIEELIYHGIASGEAEAAILAANAGVDMDMCSWVYLKNIPMAVRAGKITEAAIDEHVRHILRLKFTLGLFENPYADPEQSQAMHMLPESQVTMRSLAAQSMILLKNNGVLPLPKEKINICLSGPLADQRRELFGCWTLDGQDEDVTTLKEAMTANLAPNATLHYHELWDEAIKMARQSDVMLLAIGESAGRSGEDNCTATIDLPPGQEELVEAAHRMGIPVVTVVFGGRPLNLTRIADWSDAIVFAWHPGVTGGLGIADVLFGDVNPSGRLPVSFPRSTGQIPIYYNHLPTGRPLPSNSRHHSRYNDVPDSPLYPFGYGLSYTTFEYANIQVDKTTLTAGESLVVSAKVTNTGKVAGETVAQCYIRDMVASRSRPIRELKGFAHLTLQPGESQWVEFSIGPKELCFFNEDGQMILEPGVFQAWIGADSNAELGTSFEIIKS